MVITQGTKQPFIVDIVPTLLDRWHWSQNLSGVR